MTHQATLIYTEQVVRQAVFGFWRRTVGLGFLFALLAVAIGLIALVAQGDRSWIVGVLASAFVVGVSIAAAVYVVHYRNSLRKFRAMDEAQGLFSATESSFTITSSLGSATLQWSAVKELWRLPTVWLILYSKAQFSTLPLHCVPPETQAYILERVRSAGGRVA